MKAKTRKPQKPRPGYSLAEHNPELMSEYSEKNEYPASRLCFGADYPVWWKCPKGHKDYEATSRSRTRKKRPARCAKCRYEDISKNHSAPPREKSLGYLYPDLTKEWSPQNKLSPFEVYAYSDSKKYWWVCEKHGDYKAYCYNKTKLNSKCPACSHSGPVPYSESLGSIYPHLIPEWSPKNDCTPFEVWGGGSYLALWKCPKGHKDYPATCYHRTCKNSTGCPRCANNQTSVSEQNLRISLFPFGASPDSKIRIGKWNVDIYFPEKKTIVEYDGSRWHSFAGKWEVDRRKSLELLDMGYRVIRIRTYFSLYRLESLNIDDENYFEIFYEEPRNSKPSKELIDNIISLL